MSTEKTLLDHGHKKTLGLIPPAGRVSVQLEATRRRRYRDGGAARVGRACPDGRLLCSVAVPQCRSAAVPPWRRGVVAKHPLPKMAFNRSVLGGNGVVTKAESDAQDKVPARAR